MKRIFVIAAMFCASVSTAGAEDLGVSFDGSSAASGKAWDIQRGVAWDVPAPVPALESIARFRDYGLTQEQRTGILLSLDSSAWTASSGDNYAFQWMPQRFKLVGGSTLLVEVRTQAAGMTPNILVPVKVTGDKYEFGPWNYSHCSPSMTFQSCFFKVRVQFEVVSDSVLQGTVYSQNSSGPNEANFVYYKKDRSKDLVSHSDCINSCINTWLNCTGDKCQKNYDCCTKGCDNVTDPNCK